MSYIILKPHVENIYFPMRNLNISYITASMRRSPGGFEKNYEYMRLIDAGTLVWGID